jgi:hypothetical protein
MARKRSPRRPGDGPRDDDPGPTGGDGGHGEDGHDGEGDSGGRDAPGQGASLPVGGTGCCPGSRGCTGRS